MAWPRDKQEIIEFIEDGIVETLYVAGYLEGIPDPQAAKCGEKMRALYEEWKTLRLKQYVQMGLWHEQRDD